MSFLAIYVTAQNAINPVSCDLSNVLYILYIIILLLLLYIYITFLPPPPYLPIYIPPYIGGVKINVIYAESPVMTGDINGIEN
jgi:hypothetical protein